MQWIKDKVGGSGKNGTPDENFIVGSDKWMGSSHNSVSSSTPMAPRGSFKDHESAAQAAVQNHDAQPNPYVQHVQPALPKTESSDKGLPRNNSSSKSLYPKIYDNSDKRQGSINGVPDEEEVEVLTGTQVLVTIPGAIVHLIDDEQSVHLATGDFSLVRLVQEKTKVVVIAKVGEDLKWPMVQEERTVKLDPTHYFFTLKVPNDIENDSSKSQKSSLETDPGKMDVLNYGVTFPAGLVDDQSARIRELDFYLERYSTFSAPTIVQGDGINAKEPEALKKLPPPQDRNFPGKIVPAEAVSSDGKLVDEETSAAFWTTISPNVNDYNSMLAKGIATGAGHIIRGIFWFSDSTIAKLDGGHIYMRAKFKPKKEHSKISPITMASVRRVRKLSGMTDQVTKGVLGGIVYTTGLLSSAVINSAPGQAFFKHLPGEVALVSLDAFGRIFDALEKAGTDVLVRSSSVTQDFVNYRYGEAAKELTDESFRTAGHVASTAWTVTKIRKALNPNKLKVSKTNVAKSLGKAAAVSLSKKASV